MELMSCHCFHELTALYSPGLECVPQRIQKLACEASLLAYSPSRVLRLALFDVMEV
jgi:hypothetical protein